MVYGQNAPSCDPLIIMGTMISHIFFHHISAVIFLMDYAESMNFLLISKSKKTKKKKTKKKTGKSHLAPLKKIYYFEMSISGGCK